MLLAHKKRQMDAELEAATSAARRRLQAGGMALPQQTAVSVVCAASGCSVTLENVTFDSNTGACGAVQAAALHSHSLNRSRAIRHICCTSS